MDLVSQVETTILTHGLMDRGDRVLVAVSGGPDSVALLRLLLELRPKWGWEMAVAHVHHGLRGEDAEEDLRFVQAMASSAGVEFLVRRIAPGSLRGSGRSLQEVARMARFGLLEEMRGEFAASRIALGHQADDQAETVLAALIRGAGLAGLGGMPYRRGHIIRPLLDTAREELMEYLRREAIPFREDPSNEDSRFLRVRIRKEVLPLMRRRLNPALREVLCRTARICAMEEEYMTHSAASTWAQTAIQGEREVLIPVHRYTDMPMALRLRILRMGYARLRGNTRDLALHHCHAMDLLAMERRGRERWLHLPKGVRFGVSGGYILFTEEENTRERSFSYSVTVPGETRVPEAGLCLRWILFSDGKGVDGVLSREAAVMDFDKMVQPLILRSPVAGDRLRPKGLRGSRKVQDLLVDARVPRRDRWRVPVLADARGVLWVVGHRLDERVIPNEASIRLLVVRVLPLRER